MTAGVINADADQIDYDKFWDENDYVPPLVYTDIKYDNLISTIELIDCYLQCANYYKIAG